MKTNSDNNFPRAKTFISDGVHYYICETCGYQNRIQIGRTECENCGAWYLTEVVQTNPGADFAGPGPQESFERNPSAEEFFGVDDEEY